MKPWSMSKPRWISLPDRPHQQPSGHGSAAGVNEPMVLWLSSKLTGESARSTGKGDSSRVGAVQASEPEDAFCTLAASVVKHQISGDMGTHLAGPRLR